MGANASQEALREIDDGKKTMETVHVHAHSATWIEAVYTNEPVTVDLILEKYERWLEEEEIKFIGLDLEDDRMQTRVAVMQIATREHVLVFHMIR
jgi:hypothetical protein